MRDFPSSFLIFGCGNMGGAMLRGWIAGGVEAERFTVVDPFVEGLPEGVKLYRAASEVDGRFNVALLGIKPQMIVELATDIAPLLNSGAILISILAGIEMETLSGYFADSKIVRLMPNLAAAIGKSPLGLWSSALGDAEQAKLSDWLAPLGTLVWLSGEDQMNAVTALAGSGPAFVYRYIDALAQAGTALGLPKDMADALTVNMVEGAALLAAQASENPTELAARVTSPGGTTAAGLAVLDHDGALSALVEQTLRAASDRGAELAKGK